MRLAVPQIALNSAWIRARSRSAYRSATTAIATGRSPPAPSPWRPRAATSCGIERANAHASPPMRNRLVASSSTRRRP